MILTRLLLAVALVASGTWAHALLSGALGLVWNPCSVRWAWQS